MVFGVIGSDFVFIVLVSWLRLLDSWDCFSVFKIWLRVIWFLIGCFFFVFWGVVFLFRICLWIYVLSGIFVVCFFSFVCFLNVNFKENGILIRVFVIVSFFWIWFGGENNFLNIINVLGGVMLFWDIFC